MRGGGGWGEVAGSQPMSTAVTVHRSPNKLWRSNSIFNLWVKVTVVIPSYWQEGTRFKQFWPKVQLFFNYPWFRYQILLTSFTHSQKYQETGL
jgi:hypothetical protein